MLGFAYLFDSGFLLGHGGVDPSRHQAQPGEHQQRGDHVPTVHLKTDILKTEHNRTKSAKNV